jgi:hypothetical protein
VKAKLPFFFLVGCGIGYASYLLQLPLLALALIWLVVGLGVAAVVYRIGWNRSQR